MESHRSECQHVNTQQVGARDSARRVELKENTAAPPLPRAKAGYIEITVATSNVFPSWAILPVASGRCNLMEYAYTIVRCLTEI